MKSGPSINLATAVAFAVIAVGGFLLGAYLWFGGNVWVHQTFGWVALLIGTAMAACRWLVFPQCWPLHVALLAGSQFLFFVAVAAGQVFYFGPGSPRDAVHLFASAIQGGL